MATDLSTVTGNVKGIADLFSQDISRIGIEMLHISQCILHRSGKGENIEHKHEDSRAKMRI
jgi:hypothetical protein